MRRRREVLLLAGVMLVLLAVTIASGVLRSRAEAIPPFSSNSNQPDGARALRLWLASAGYPVSNAAVGRFAVPEGSDVVLILEPLPAYPISADEWSVLDGWLEQGGTLLLAANRMSRALADSPFALEARFAPQPDARLYPPAPIFQSPPMSEPARLALQNNLVPHQSQAVQPLLAGEDGLAALHFARGAGRVILIADAGFLSNQGLKEPGNAALALNLFALLPKGSRIWIDEWHHGERTGREPGVGPEAWLTSTPAGFAVLFAAGVIFLGLLLGGRPFGRPVPLPGEQQRRSALEYVTALANLNRRAGHRRALMRYYHTTLKRAYGRRYRLDPGLPDAAYVAQLAQYNPALDAPALLGLLERLDQKTFSEVQVVQLAREAADWLGKLER